MSKSERMLLIKMFSEQRPQQFKDQTFNYAAFCEILQVCSMSAVHPPAPTSGGPQTLHQSATPKPRYLQPFAGQPCNDTRITMTPAYVRLKEELDNFNPDMSGDSPYAIQVTAFRAIENALD